MQKNSGHEEEGRPYSVKASAKVSAKVSASAETRVVGQRQRQHRLPLEFPAIWPVAMEIQANLTLPLLFCRSVTRALRSCSCCTSQLKWKFQYLGLEDFAK